MSLLPVLLAGCNFAPTLPGSGDVIDGNRDETVTSPVGKTSGEPNDSFETAVVAVFDNGGLARLQGTVSRAGDLDVFLLDRLAPGDRVIVDVATPGSVLDASVALFDDRQRLAYANDDRGGEAGRFLDSYVDFVIRHVGDPYYLVVTNSAFAQRERLTGSYALDVRVSAGVEVPAPQPQVFVLDFDGAFIDSPVLGTIMLDPFDAGDISPRYANQTEALKAGIRAVFEENFSRFHVIIATSDDPPPVDEFLVSRVYFGGFNAGAFGLAETVDLYNFDFCDDAIIYTESFSPNVFSFVPSVTDLALAIGNVAAHEAGHLLGLNHTDDDHDLMDARSPADAFVTDQEFMEAPLSGDIMSIGVQDGVLLLDETVGPLPPQ